MLAHPSAKRRRSRRPLPSPLAAIALQYISVTTRPLPAFLYICFIQAIHDAVNSHKILAILIHFRHFPLRNQRM
jgi:hypothetical protein